MVKVHAVYAGKHLIAHQKIGKSGLLYRSQSFSVISGCEYAFSIQLSLTAHVVLVTLVFCFILYNAVHLGQSGICSAFSSMLCVDAVKFRFNG